MAQFEEKNDKNGVSSGRSFGPFSFKLLVSKYSSTDGIDRTSAYYRDALSQHGPVLDCSAGSPAAQAPKSENKFKEPKDDRLAGDEVSALL